MIVYDRTDRGLATASSPIKFDCAQLGKTLFASQPTIGKAEQRVVLLLQAVDRGDSSMQKEGFLLNTAFDKAIQAFL
jgi:hypothetical protein